MTSRTEEITSEVRKLVLTCRSFEAQLQQSIPKKKHEEIVSKMQQTIDEAKAELERTQEELKKTVSLGDALGAMQREVSEQISCSRSDVIKMIEERLAVSMVPNQLYEQSVSKIRELEESIGKRESGYAEIGKRNAELQEELQRTREQGVSKEEQCTRAQARISELETALQNSMPRSDFDAVVREVASLTSGVSTMMVHPSSFQNSIVVGNGGASTPPVAATN